MVKKITTISIEENILKKAKKEIPNLSDFVEECLKAYFGFEDKDLMVIDDNRQKIRECMLMIHLTSKKNNTIEEEVQFNETELNTAWSNLWRKYRNGQATNKDILEAEKTLKIGSSELKGLLDNLELSVNREDLVKCDEWSFAMNYL